MNLHEERLEGGVCEAGTSVLDCPTAAALSNHDDHSQDISRAVVPEFEALVRSYAVFNTIFFALIAIESFLLILLFPFLLKSSLVAFGLAGLFLTLFAFFVFRSYHVAEKPERLKGIVDKFTGACKTLTNYREGVPEDHLKLSSICIKLSNAFASKELSLYRSAGRLKAMNPYLEKIGRRWHWKDVHQIRELLLLAALNENIKLVRCAPTSFEVHTSLANAYVILATLYHQAKSSIAEFQSRWWPQSETLQEMHSKVGSSLLKAVEEFKILQAYAPNDPWVHQQLAYCYQDLGMRDEEIAEYELMTKINPQDQEAWFKLGELYFKEGRNAKGLSIYELLKAAHPKKAAHLIELYGQITE